jgi:hypothetical protein
MELDCVRAIRFAGLIVARIIRGSSGLGNAPPGRASNHGAAAAPAAAGNGSNWRIGRCRLLARHHFCRSLWIFDQGHFAACRAKRVAERGNAGFLRGGGKPRDLLKFFVGYAQGGDVEYGPFRLRGDHSSSKSCVLIQ